MNKKIMSAAILLSMVLVLTSCQWLSPRGGQKEPGGVPAPPGNSGAMDNNLLAGLLPEREGFTWVYSGFAEYGHRMTLDSLETGDNRYVYNISGLVDDPSGGEARDRDFNINITYEIAGGILTQEKRESTMLDSPFDHIQLIKLPLEEGMKWTQRVSSRDGDTVELECVIEKIEEDEGSKKYTVLYRQLNSDYYEKRVFQEGLGIITFEKLLETGEQSFPAGYYLYGEASGYSGN